VISARFGPVNTLEKEIIDNPDVVFAGFWPRVLAQLIDGGIFWALYFVGNKIHPGFLHYLIADPMGHFTWISLSALYVILLTGKLEMDRQ